MSKGRSVWLRSELDSLSTADDILSRAKANNDDPREAYAEAFGALTAEYDQLMRLCNIAVDELDELERRYDVLTNAIEQQPDHVVDEIYAKADWL